MKPRVNSETTLLDNYWRIIPPEEKLEILSLSQGKGLMFTGIFIYIFLITAVGYYSPWLILFAFLLSPVAYQVTSNKIWNMLKAQTLIYYLAAKSAARRIAYSLNCNELEVRLLFRASLEEKITMDAFEETVSVKPVWVAVFQEAVVVFEERKGGAVLRFGSLFGPKLNVDIDQNKITLQRLTYGQDRFKYILTSKYAVAFKACQDMLTSYQTQALKKFDSGQPLFNF